MKSDDLRYLCADEAAFQLCPSDPESVAFAAGRLFLKQIAEARRDRENVILESTLSGKSLVSQIQKFRDQGYAISMLFVSPLEEAASLTRVKIRVEKGGHFVPPEDIIRRFRRAHHNFWASYRHLETDGWSLFFNETGIGHRRIALGYGDEVIVEDPASFERFQEFC